MENQDKETKDENLSIPGENEKEYSSDPISSLETKGQAPAPPSPIYGDMKSLPLSEEIQKQKNISMRTKRLIFAGVVGIMSLLIILKVQKSPDKTSDSTHTDFPTITREHPKLNRFYNESKKQKAITSIPKTISITKQTKTRKPKRVSPTKTASVTKQTKTRKPKRVPPAKTASVTKQTKTRKPKRVSPTKTASITKQTKTRKPKRVSPTKTARITKQTKTRKPKRVPSKTIKQKDYFLYGIDRHHAGNNTEAIKAFRKGMAEDPDLKDIGYNNQGVIFTQKGSYKKGILYLKLALKVNPRYADAHYNLAAAYERNKSNQKAFFHYQRFLELAEDKHSVLVAQVEHHLGR